MKQWRKNLVALLSGLFIAGSAGSLPTTVLAATATQSPIKHVVIIYQENRSFDSYFGTYPHALDDPGYVPLLGTPAVDGIPAGSYNPDQNGNKIYPWVMAAGQDTKDPDHGYNDMIASYDRGLMDKFYIESQNHNGGGKFAMGHHDWRSIPAYWAYAQHFTIADNWFQPIFGPSTPGNLFLGAARSGTAPNGLSVDVPPLDGPQGGDLSWWQADKAAGRLIPNFTYENMGDNMAAHGVSWAWYQGGYGDDDDTYASHHNPFQYFQNYEDGKYKDNLKDYSMFAEDIAAGTLPSVSLIKAGYPQDEHPVNSTCQAGMDFAVDNVNLIMQSPYWKDTLIIITYDDTGGFWDHVPPPQVTPGPDGLQGEGPRLPVMMISPYVKENYVSHVQYDTTSILKFIEWNWGIPALNNRDAAAANLTDVFDFNHPDFTPYIFDVGGTAPQSAYGVAANVYLNNTPMAAGLTAAGEGPFINRRGHTMVPLAELARNINATLRSDPAGNLVTMVSGSTAVQFQKDSDRALVNGHETRLTDNVWESPGGNIYVPLRPVADLLGFAVGTGNGIVKVLTN